MTTNGMMNMVDATRIAGPSAGAAKKRWIKADPAAVPESHIEGPELGSASGKDTPPVSVGKRRSAKEMRAAMYGEK